MADQTIIFTKKAPAAVGPYVGSTPPESPYGEGGGAGLLTGSLLL